MEYDLKNKEILIIDDEQPIVDIVMAVLAREGAKPSGISSAEKATQMTRTNDYDAIILDRYMPYKDGHALLKEFKANSKTKDTPVIMLTGESKQSEIQKSLELGVAGYVIKPFKPKSFLMQLKKILG